MRGLTPLFVLAVLATATTGCKHTVEIRSTPPGAMVSENGVDIGATPLIYEEDLGSKEQVQLQLDRDGVDQTLVIQREQMQWNGIGIGALAGVGGCCALGVAGGAIAAIFPPAALIGALGPIFPVVGALIGWMQWGYSLPDVVDVNLQNGEVETMPMAFATLTRAEGESATIPAEIPPPSAPVARELEDPATEFELETPPSEATGAPPPGDSPPPLELEPSAEPEAAEVEDVRADSEDAPSRAKNPPPVATPDPYATDDETNDDDAAEEVASDDATDDGFGAPVAPDELRY